MGCDECAQQLALLADQWRAEASRRPARDIEVVAIQERTEVREIPCGLALRWPGTTT